MSRAKHLLIIHGRSTKPSEADKKRFVKKALHHGLNRADPTGSAVDRLKSKDIKYSFVFYGDISNKRMLEKNPSLKDKLTAIDPKHKTPCEPPDRFIQPLEELLKITNQTKNAYKKFLKKNRDLRGLDNIASMVSWVANLTGFSDNIIKAATADMGAYLMERKTGSAIRVRLAEPLKRALQADHDICLVSHSMGCIVSYDVLWKFSQMSDYKDVQKCGNKINSWITIGNPLGEPGVRKNLYDADERSDGKFPRDIIKHWLNIPARDDFVSHDNTIEDDFRDMTPYVESIKDHPEVYTFWTTDKGTNPHKLYGYLDNKTVAEKIVQWMES
jgi:hypothetical protein